MAGLYADTSALGRVLLSEPGAAAVETAAESYESLWSSELLIVELRRIAYLNGLEVAAERFLDGV